MTDTSTPTDPSVDPQVVDPTKVIPTLAAQNTKSVNAAQQADDVLGSFIQTNNQIQAQREANLQSTVTAKNQINDTVQKSTQDFTSTVQPIFQRRVAIANRQAEIAAMNPFERFVKGITSREYNPVALANADKAAQDQLAAQGQMYQATMGVNDTLLKGVQDTYDNNDALLQLHAQDGLQDVQLASQVAGSAQQVFGAEVAGLNAQSDVMRAQSQARQDLLGGMTLDQVNHALTQAHANNGNVIVNGVTLREGELKDLQMSWQDKNLALESRQVALSAGRIDLANAQESRLISHMTGPELEAAVSSGGKYRGQTLNQEALTQALAVSHQRSADIANQSTMTTGVNVGIQAINGLAQNQRYTEQQATGLFGQIPKELQSQGLSIAARVTAFSQGFQDANSKGAGAQYVAQNMPQLQAMQKEQEDLRAQLATRYGGTDKNVQAVAMGWLSGQPVSGETAVKGLITLARNGLPAGTHLTPAAQQQFNTAKAIVQQADAGSAGDSVNSLFNAATGRANTSAAQKETNLESTLTRALQSGYSNNSMSQALASAPRIAATVNDTRGQPLAFSRITPQDFAQAQQSGDAEGYRVIAHNLGIKPQEAEMLFRQGPSGNQMGQLTQKAAAGKRPAPNYAELSAQLQAAQSQGLLKALDLGPRLNGVRPSQAYVEAMNNPEVQKKMMDGTQNQASANLGEYVLNNIAPNSFNQTLYGYGTSLQNAYSTQQNNMRNESIRAAPETMADPYKFTGAALATMKDMSPSERQELTNAVRAAVPTNYSISDSTPIDSAKEISDRIDTWMNTKNPSPALDAIRRKAQAQWTDAKSHARGLLQFQIDHGSQ